MKSIFVGNLPWSATDADLSAKFSEFGTVLSARVMTDKFSGICNEARPKTERSERRRF